jgi:hypothetical protein
MTAVLRTARSAFEETAGRRVESVSSVTRDDEGWRLAFEVVELERIPDSTSLLGSYEVLADGDGNLVGYERVRRYHRNRADEEV